MIAQLPLEFNLLDNTTFSNFFFSTNNQQLLFALKNFVDLDNSQEGFFYLWGGKEVGKTHLLQACCSSALEKNIPAIYISLSNLLVNTNKINIDFFDGLENLSLLCLDDLHLVENSRFEEKLFYLFNNIRAKQHKLIVAARCVPNSLKLQLPDLKSRMAWGITYCLQGLTEQEKITALIMRAEQIGLQLSEPVANFLLSRVSRSTGQLFSILENLDNASLAAKRKLTIPFIKEVLGL
jgi:DnaA family protein